MSKHVTARRPQGSGTKQPKRRKQRYTRAAKSGRGFWVVAAVVVVIGIAGVVAVASGRNSGGKSGPASAALMRKATSVPARVFADVGTGTANPLPKPISAPALTEDGKPEVLYVGAEYCPYCATERWAMVVALSRFGSFSGLGTTHSSTTDVFPDTQTFSFHGATYRSRWLAFSGVETESNVQQGDGYAPLDTLTGAEQQVYATYDRSPYVGSASSSAGGIPFIDFGGKYLVGGVTYDPSVLQGKSLNSIADALSDPTSDIARGAIGSANALTAAMCTLTHDQPSSVCSSPVIHGIQSSL